MILHFKEHTHIHTDKQHFDQISIYDSSRERASLSADKERVQIASDLHPFPIPFSGVDSQTWSTHSGSGYESCMKHLPKHFHQDG